MPQIVQAGAINTTALVVPDLYVQIIPPALILNGVPTNILGLVGSAVWGPVNQAVTVGSYSQYVQSFGNLVARKYDMGTHVYAAAQQGASNFRCVRVTDGTDTKATSTGIASCITFSALYSGSLGNQLSVALTPSQKTGTYRVTVTLPGLSPEIYDNITGSGNALYVNIAAAINSGAGILTRGPSNLISATASSGTTAPTVPATFTFTGGTDGATGVTATTLVGVDASGSSHGTGMYVLRGQNCQVGALCDADTSTEWTIIDGFGQSEGIYMIQVSPEGSAIQNGATGTIDLMQAAGLADYSSKMMHGDWIYWNDPVNGVIRLISPQPFAAGRLVSLTPNQTALNKMLYGVVGSQKSGLATAQITTYSSAELQLLFENGADVITNPAPGGNYWTVRGGFNTSVNPSIEGDEHTGMINYISKTLAAGMGLYVGQPITTSLFTNISATLNSFFATLVSQGLLDNTYGTPYSVVCNTTNNPQSRTSIGYVQADVAVQFEGINRYFIVNLDGGATVTVQVSSSATPTATS
jgi:hypothetical protein